MFGRLCENFREPDCGWLTERLARCLMVRACDGSPAETSVASRVRNDAIRFSRRFVAGRLKARVCEAREAIVIDDPDSRSSLSIGLDWGARVTSIGLEFCVPAVLGHFADRWLSTTPWLTVSGALLGMAVGMLHVLRLPAELAKSGDRAKAGRRPNSGDSTPREASGGIEAENDQH